MITLSEIEQKQIRKEFNLADQFAKDLYLKHIKPKLPVDLISLSPIGLQYMEMLFVRYFVCYYYSASHYEQKAIEENPLIQAASLMLSVIPGLSKRVNHIIQVREYEEFLVREKFKIQDYMDNVNIGYEERWIIHFRNQMRNFANIVSRSAFSCNKDKLNIPSNFQLPTQFFLDLDKTLLPLISGIAIARSSQTNYTS